MRQLIAFAKVLVFLLNSIAVASLATTAIAETTSDVSVFSIETIVSDSGAKRFLSISEHAVTWTYFDTRPPIHAMGGRRRWQRRPR